MSEALTVPVSAYVTHTTVPFYASGRGREESAAGILLAAILLGLAALVVNECGEAVGTTSNMTGHKMKGDRI